MQTGDSGLGDNSLREAIQQNYLMPQQVCLKGLLEQISFSDAALQRIHQNALKLVKSARKQIRDQHGLDAFLSEYDLSSKEGVILMCLAEALLRIPDTTTMDRLIKDKLGGGDWEDHIGKSESLFVNASTWGLMLTGSIVRVESESKTKVEGILKTLVTKSGEPAIRLALREAMRIMSKQFVHGRTIEEAWKNSRTDPNRDYRYAFDMLGEAALCRADASHYFQSYADAIKLLGHRHNIPELWSAPNLSVKLSALHPRYEFSQSRRLQDELVPLVAELVGMARQAGISVTLDAEEVDRLEPLLDIFERVFNGPKCEDWPGFGIAVQSYQKRAFAVVDWLAELANRRGRKIMLRLVKGAYWDTEIKRTQVAGLADYPVFTFKSATDVSYLACAKHIWERVDAFYPQFATHNAHTIASILELAGNHSEYEFQRLHGMGEILYSTLRNEINPQVNCRVYAPVGNHKDLLPYLVRRLLENGANTSFINRIADQEVDVESLISDPRSFVQDGLKPNRQSIPLPRDLYQGRWKNSLGINLSDTMELEKLTDSLSRLAKLEWKSSAAAAAKAVTGQVRSIANPADMGHIVGYVADADLDSVDDAIQSAQAAFVDWSGTPGKQRADLLDAVADGFERRADALIYLCIKEGGRCIPDSCSELREAMDFCRYYAYQIRENQASSIKLPGPAGESNQLRWKGRGVFACISPWNFPLAIFTGQIAAALAVGNSVIAKPAHQTPLVAALAVDIMHQAGIPPDVLHLLPGSGRTVGGRLIEDPRIAGIAFTGSTETAQHINRVLASKSGPIVPLIAETGGQNVMIVDSSALPEQVVKDVIRSGFNSAGQRCSALRVLFVQEEIADRVKELLSGAMDELCIGDPMDIATDVGPVIDDAAKSELLQHITRMKVEAREIKVCSLSSSNDTGNFVPPSLFEIDSLSQLEKEVFGPIVHLIRFDRHHIDHVIDAVNQTGYGLTLGIHSRVERTVQYIQQRVLAGNIYINRDMIGAVVGVQPFGGEGLSGTGPKAGGPHYLYRFASEQTITNNTAAMGGDPDLLSLKRVE